LETQATVTRSPAGRASWLGPGLALGLHALSLAFFLSASPHSRWDFPLDDAWIHQVYARAIAGGEGFAYNEGQQEAGSTSPLWTAVTAPVHWLAGDSARGVVAGVKALGALCSLWAVWSLWQVAQRATASAAAATAAASVFAVEPRLAFAALSGMETALLVALWLACWHLTLAGRPGRAMALLGLAPLVRPEAIGLQPFGLAALWLCGTVERGFWRRPGPWLALVAPGLVWAALCKLIAGSWLPNSFHLKASVQGVAPEAVLTAARLLAQHGWARAALVFAAVLAVHSVWLLLRAGRGGHGERVALALGVAAPLAYLGAVVVSRSVELHGYYWTRWADPASLVLTASFGLALATALFTASRRELTAVGLAALALSLPALGQSSLERRARLASDGRAIRSLNVAAGQWIAEHTPPEAVVAVNDAGALRYFGRRRTLDLIGLNNAEILHRRVTPEQIFAEVDWLAIFPSAVPGAETRFEERQEFLVPIWEYTICECPGQTRIWIGEKRPEG